MLQIKQRDVTPPGGWSFQVEGGPLITANTFGDLVLRVLDYRVQHGQSTDNLAAVVEDEICRRKNIKCAPPRPAPDGSARSIGVADVWRFLMTMKEWMKNGNFVAQEEAERRAETCAGCTQNTDITDGSCWGCAGIFPLVQQLIGDRTTRMEHALKNCRICGCLNSVSCWVPIDVLTRASGDLEYPQDTGQQKEDGSKVPCWKR